MIRRLYQFLLVLFCIFLALLILYAVPLTRPWMEANLGPPLSTAFGSTWNAITNSGPYRFLLANPLWIAIISLFLGIFPVSFPIIHRSFNTVRGKAVRSSVTESSLYPKQQAPTHTVTQLQPKPEPTKETVTPIPEVAPKEEVKPEVEETG